MEEGERLPARSAGLLGPCRMRPGPPECELLGSGRKASWSHQGRIHVLLLKAKGGGTRFLQLSGRKADQRVRLQLILDEPPQALENKWIKERVEYYMRCEPHAPPEMREWRPVVGQGSASATRMAWGTWGSFCGTSFCRTLRSQGLPRSMGQRKRLSSRGDCHSQRGRGGAGAVSPDPNRPGTGWGQSSPVLDRNCSQPPEGCPSGTQSLDGDFADKTLPRKHCSPLRRL